MNLNVKEEGRREREDGRSKGFSRLTSSVLRLPASYVSRLPCPLPVACILVLSVFLFACSDMYDQPSFKAQEGPRPGPPAGSVPVTGIENIDWGTALENPVPAGRTSIDRGRELFAINCAMCHGKSGRGDGRVGAHFTPPPPNLHEQRIIALADADIFKRIALGFGRMPAFKKRITPEDRWNLVNFVRELQRPEEEKKK